jgi:hypothetical protein
MMTRDEWIAILGLLTNLQEGRMKLTDRKGDVMEMTIDEQQAVAKFRKAWHSGQIEYNG